MYCADIILNLVLKNLGVNKNFMENKTTTELLDLLYKIENLPDDKADWDKYEEVLTELRTRNPFKEIIGESMENDEATLQEKVEELLEDVKLLKRHKHDINSGDVLVRI
jgi:NH3-dependent NAD+ synthetase